MFLRGNNRLHCLDQNGGIVFVVVFSVNPVTPGSLGNLEMKQQDIYLVTRVYLI